MNILTKHLKLVFTTFLIFISYNAQAASSYKMPIGIPDTTLDFQQEMPVRPSDWSVEKAGYYYINYQTGSDKQTYGTPEAPRKSFPAPALAGSYIEIAGEYTQGFTSKQNRVYRFNGTDDVWSAGVAGPVWVTEAKDTDGVISSIGFIITGTNVFISDLDFINDSKLQIGSASDGYPAENIVARNIDISGGGLSISGNKKVGTTKANNIVVFNSKIHDFGDLYSTTDDDNDPILISAGVSNVWVLENEIYNASGAGLQVLGTAERGITSNIYAGGNDIHHVRQSGMWLKYGSNIVFSSNYVHDIISTSWSPAKGMGAQYAPDNFWMINNHISGVEYGIRVGSTDSTTWDKKLYIIGNVIHDVEPVQAGQTVGSIASTSSWQSAGIHLASADELYVFNNLIFDVPNGIDVSSSNAKTWVKNNIILDVTRAHTEGNTGYHIMFEYINLNEYGFIDNNYFGEGMNVYTKDSGNKSQDDSVATLNARAGASGNVQGTNIITPNNIDSIMDAKSIDSLDFTKINDAGTNVNDILITRFISLFPDTSEIDSDIFDKPRNLGNSIDIGPFEMNGFIPEKPTEAPVTPIIIDVIQIE